MKHARNPDEGQSFPGKPGGATHLAGEQSPYLRQHIDDPVAWYPWGEEAFAAARKEDRPVFLSIGYSTCHWCHVMAKESFRDPGVARILNESFVCIKVDREERPDIDRIYMAVCQMMTGTGGWPLSIFLTPDKKPFYAATYIPREGRFGGAGMLDLLPRIAQLWRERRPDLTGSADKVTAALAGFFPSAGAGNGPDPDLLSEAYHELVLRFDPEYGGFGTAPKFPMPGLLLFLLRYWKRTGIERALTMVKKTLDGIRCGGIYDHIGGGVHRYSTDTQWRVPHFEKMLYDQALLALAFTEAFQATGAPRYREAAEDILAYMLRNLRAPGGGFYAAEDADSPGGEGAFYRWDKAELIRVLGEQDAAIAQAVFCIPQGPALNGETQGSILYRSSSQSALARKTGLSPDEFEVCEASIRRRLLQERDKRPRPSRDEKILADMNGLAIAAFAKASQVFHRPDYAAEAGAAAAFVLGRMRAQDGGIFHRFCCGEAAVPGFAEDYAGIIFGLLELYEATFDQRHLEEAHTLVSFLLQHFHDEEKGGFYTTADSAEQVLVRVKDIHDGVVPSSNALVLISLLRLSHLDGTPGYEETAASIFRAFWQTLKDSPSSHAFFLCALDYATGNPVDVVIAGARDDPEVHAMADVCRTAYLPNLLVRHTGMTTEDTTGYNDRPQVSCPMVEGRATAYVCVNRACHAPVTSAERLSRLLNEIQERGHH